MNVRHALVRNTAWYGLVTTVGVVSGLVMSIVLARGLGPALMGDLSYVIWAERTLTAMATLGYAFATVRYTAESFGREEVDRAWGFVRLFMRGQLVMTALVTLAVTPIVVGFADAHLRAPLLVIVATLSFVTIEGIYTHALQGAQRYDITARTSTLKMALQLVVAALAIALGVGLPALLAGMGITLAVSCWLQRRRVHEVYAAGLRAPPAPMTAEVRAYLLPLSIVAVLDAIVWDRSPVFFLGLHASSEAIAFYSLAFGLATRVMIVPGIVAGALLPALAALHGGGAPEEFEDLYRSALRYVALAGAPLAAIVAALGPGVILWLYGAAYLPAAPLVGALAGVALLSALRAVVWTALRAVGDRSCALVATAVAAVVNLGLAATLVPRWTTAGAVIATSAAQLTATAWVFAGMQRRYRTRLPLADLARIAAAGALTFVVTWAMAGDFRDPLRLVAAAVLGFAVYLLACVAARLVGPREWGLLTTSTRRLLQARGRNRVAA
ncbi:MAG TPA: polysaccharide biosynthesis C-terminal domain-containing protein [Methylomirabilota bacterium]|nr:polysaccharide biosynthesis C-terminal domain-containing protein [Methylomirabilota bacterium]